MQSLLVHFCNYALFLVAPTTPDLYQLASLPSQISYNTLRIPAQSSGNDIQDEATEVGQSRSKDNTLTTRICRRSLFDIRAQLMAEANPSAHEAESAETLLAGLENGDLSSGIYEGGFKTWECALDLASQLIGPMNPFSQDQQAEQDWEVIELGAGSAIPSLTIICDFLRRSEATSKTRGHGNLKITLCDYNEDVLRLATAPNIFLNYVFASGRAISLSGQESEDEGDIDLEELGGEAFIENTCKAMLNNNLSLSFISGGWGDDFINLLTSSSSSERASLPSLSITSKNRLILASETIYSPSSIKTFSRTLLSLLISHEHHSGRAKAWIAAKKVYFGVGGGVDEFVREIERLGGSSTVIFETKDTGVGRVILEVTTSST